MTTSTGLVFLAVGVTGLRDAEQLGITSTFRCDGLQILDVIVDDSQNLEIDIMPGISKFLRLRRVSRMREPHGRQKGWGEGG